MSVMSFACCHPTHASASLAAAMAELPVYLSISGTEVRRAGRAPERLVDRACEVLMVLNEDVR